MTTLLMIGTFVACLPWLLARARLEAQQLRCLRVTRQYRRLAGGAGQLSWTRRRSSPRV